MNFNLFTIALLLCFGLVLSYDTQYFTFTKEGRPDFCKERECPSFVIHRHYPNAFQIRNYTAGKWVTSETIDVKLSESKRILLQRIFAYLRGNNDNLKKMSITSPVLFKVLKNPGRGYSKHFRMMMWISEANPPKPRDANVSVRDVPPFQAFVRSFPGYVSDKMTWVDEKNDLRKDVKKSGFSPDNSFFYAASYDKPTDKYNRHNEVWLVPRFE